MKLNWQAQGSMGFTKDGHARGELTLRRQFLGETVDCRQSADLRAFPFDSFTQRMTATLGADVSGSSKYVRWDPCGGAGLVRSGTFLLL